MKFKIAWYRRVGPWEHLFHDYFVSDYCKEHLVHIINSLKSAKSFSTIVSRVQLAPDSFVEQPAIILPKTHDIARLRTSLTQDHTSPHHPYINNHFSNMKLIFLDSFQICQTCNRDAEFMSKSEELTRFLAKDSSNHQ